MDLLLPAHGCSDEAFDLACLCNGKFHGCYGPDALHLMPSGYALPTDLQRQTRYRMEQNSVNLHLGVKRR